MRIGKDIIYVALQVLLLLLFVFDFKIFNFQVPQVLKVIALFFVIGGAVVVLIALLQLGRNLSPFPSPKKNGVLITSGFFHYIRHPIYTGIILSSISISIFFGSGWKLGMSFLLLILFLLKSTYEEGKLAQRFPAYKEYRKSTGRFLPNI